MNFWPLTILLLLFWVLLTGSLAWFNLFLGLLLSLGLGYWAVRFLWGRTSPLPTFRRLIALPAYFLVLLGLIVVASCQVARLVLNPRLPVAPQFIRYRMGLRGEAARVAFANSISLTPGAHTVDMEDDLLVIHCLAPAFARELASGRLERRVAVAFEPESTLKPESE
ncbi:Na+/H+ antiporter subunit E [Desulfurivibrio dismutans]|uniref:Na+/H+ antiporter subunit E n=1 Tax=Desulfurivibrio dismutans TaxID=1398908 RepID=UPI0023DB43D9|nr:Na+/H+ antiporter subunit E [Desulfurivibrio alkaliphilus]MDF1614412.1 Na+/H+ antiporter subunit E [Desulfurivibrio alkaliphilus]